MEKISIIIPVFNNEKTIELCINSLINLEYPKNMLEIIVSDDGSNDRTLKILRKYEKLKILKNCHRGPAATRNAGFNESNGEIIFFIDSDCIAPKKWIQESMKEFNQGIEIVGGSLKPFSIKKSSENFEQSRRDSLYGNTRKMVNYLPSCNLMMKREIFEEVRGFDEDYKYPSFEDYDLCHRIRNNNHNILYEPRIWVKHLHSSNWKGVFKRAYMHGRESMLFRKKNNISMNNEILYILKSMGNILAVFGTYPMGKIGHGIIYEILVIIGKLNGSLKYKN